MTDCLVQSLLLLLLRLLLLLLLEQRIGGGLYSMATAGSPRLQQLTALIRAVKAGTTVPGLVSSSSFLPVRPSSRRIYAWLVVAVAVGEGVISKTIPASLSRLMRGTPMAVAGVSTSHDSGRGHGQDQGQGLAAAMHTSG